MKNRKREICTSGSVRDEDGQPPHLLGHRRQVLHLAAGAAALPAVSCFAWAQAYPTRPVRIIVGFAAGGGYDIIARLIGQWLSERLGQLSGAAGTIGTESVVRPRSGPPCVSQCEDRPQTRTAAARVRPRLTARRKLKKQRAGQRASTCASTIAREGSGDLLATAPHQGEKSAASHN
jgi:hypothetical protein